MAVRFTFHEAGWLKCQLGLMCARGTAWLLVSGPLLGLSRVLAAWLGVPGAVVIVRLSLLLGLGWRIGEAVARWREFLARWFGGCTSLVPAVVPLAACVGRPLCLGVMPTLFFALRSGGCTFLVPTMVLPASRYASALGGPWLAFRDSSYFPRPQQSCFCLP